MLAPSAFAAEVDARIIARLDALERENAALRSRLNRIESSKAPAVSQRTPSLELAPELASAAQPVKAVTAVAPRRLHRFEISGSVLYLQPGAGNLEYGTLVNPLPAVSPHWVNQALQPDYSPAFAVGARYFIDASNDIAVNWTHHKATTNSGFFASPDQMAGPPYLIGPEALAYKNAHGGVQSRFDSVSLDGGHTFCVECAFQFRVFAGMEFARIRRTLTGRFQHPADPNVYHAYANDSSFTGAGPRFGMKSQYALGDFQFISEVAAAALIGNTTSRIDMTTMNGNLAGPTNQYLASPDAIQVIPSVNGKLAAAYSVPTNHFGVFQIEAGYRAAVYFNAVSQYAMTQVPTGLVLPPNGIYLATAQRFQSNYTDHGPFLSGNLKF
jgi:hypothetical protein